MRKFITIEDMPEESVIKLARKYKVKALRGHKDNKIIYFIGCWDEPMAGTIYKPSLDGNNLAKKLPKINELWRK